MTSIATHATVVALRAALVIDMIAEDAIANQQLMTTKAKVTMPISTTNPDQDHNRNQGPVLVILDPQDMIMVTIFMMMTPGGGNRHTHLLLSLAQDLTVERPLLEPYLLLFNIKTQLLN